MGNAVKKLMKCFGLPDEHVTITLGPEQEYFLIDKNFYLNRPDLVQTGRTLSAHLPPSTSSWKTIISAPSSLVSLIS